MQLVNPDTLPRITYCSTECLNDTDYCKNYNIQEMVKLVDIFGSNNEHINHLNIIALIQKYEQATK